MMQTATVGVQVSEKSRTIALLLCIFLGWLGIHRFYMGKTISGVVYLLTVGLLFIGVLIDLIGILLGNMKDTTGAVIREW